MKGQVVGGILVILAGIAMILFRRRLALVFAQGQFGWYRRLTGGLERLTHATERSFIPLGIASIAFGIFLIVAALN